MDVPEEIRTEIKWLVSLLVSGNLSDMHSRGLFGKSDLDLVDEVIASYPGKMTMPPDSAFLNLEVYGDTASSNFSADFPLWFDDMQSDLYALIVREADSASHSLYIYDIRVP